MPRLALVVSTMIGPLAAAHAQRGLDRGLTGLRGSGRDTVPMTHRAAAAVGLLSINVDTTPLKARWLIQPIGSVKKSDNDVGLLAGYKNTNRFFDFPWLLDARAVRRDRGRRAHGRWQIDGEIDPTIPPKFPILVELYGTVAQTVSIERSEELEAELDFDFLGDGSLTAGGVAYYDWNAPNDATATRGATYGFAGYFERGRFNVNPEYDLSSSFNSGTYYAVVASVLLYTTSKDIQIRLRGGWEKGNTLSVRLQFGIPNNRESPAARRSR